MRRLDSLLLNDWGIAPDGLPERTTVAGIGFTELIVFADVLHAAANPGHHGLAQFCRSRRITSSEIDTHLLDCIKNFVSLLHSPIPFARLVIETPRIDYPPPVHLRGGALSQLSIEFGNPNLAKLSPLVARIV